MPELHPLKEFGRGDLDDLRAASARAARRRAATPIHDDFSDPVQRVLMAAEPDTYVGPHRHPDKEWELLVLLEGAMDILLFSQDGTLQERIELRQDGGRAVEYPANQFHAAVIHTPGTLVFEVKRGPYIPETAKELPSWAPEEGTTEAAAARERLRNLRPGDRFS